MKELFEKKIKDITSQHAQLIEDKCKAVLIKFDCKPSDLSIEYHNKTEIKIRVLGDQFDMVNHFYIRPEVNDE